MYRNTHRSDRRSHFPGKRHVYYKIVEAVVLYQENGYIFFEEEFPDCGKKKKKFRMTRLAPTLCFFNRKGKIPDVCFVRRRYHFSWDRDWLKSGARVTILASSVLNFDETLQARAWTNRDQWNMCYPEVIKPEELLAAG